MKRKQYIHKYQVYNTIWIAAFAWSPWENTLDSLPCEWGNTSFLTLWKYFKMDMLAVCHVLKTWLVSYKFPGFYFSGLTPTVKSTKIFWQRKFLVLWYYLVSVLFFKPPSLHAKGFFYRKTFPPSFFHFCVPQVQIFVKMVHKFNALNIAVAPIDLD